MLLYVTASQGREREVELDTALPETLPLLYQRAMRDHIRPAVAEVFADGQWGKLPDWRFDRQVIQIALFFQERLEVTAETPVAVIGTSSPAWFQTDLALQGLGAVPVGLDHELDDRAITDALARESIRGVVTTDDACAERIGALRNAGVVDLEWVVAPGPPAEPTHGLVAWQYLWDQGRILDTPERASNWRYYARQIEGDRPAAVHYDAEDGKSQRCELTHSGLMDTIRQLHERCRPAVGDLAHLGTSALTLRARIAALAWIGDGVTTILWHSGLDERGWDDRGVTKVLVAASWLEALDRESGLAEAGPNRKVRRRLRERVGERVRWIGPAGVCSPDLLHRLERAGLPVSDLGPIMW